MSKTEKKKVSGEVTVTVEDNSGLVPLEIEKPNPVGRPTEYNGTIPAMVGLYINQCKEAERLPTHAGLAVYLSVCKATITNWANKHEEFLASLSVLNSMQEDSLIQNGLNSHYNSTITKLMLSSNHGYKERTDNTSGDKPLQPAIVNFADLAPKEENKDPEQTNDSDTDTKEPSAD